MSKIITASARSRVNSSLLLAASLFISTIATTDAHACACGCGMFDVGTSSMLPIQQGGVAWLEYDFMNQDKNWHHSASAPSANNDDKDIKSSFYTAGAEYMFNRAWGAEIEVPYWDRHFTTTTDTGDVARFNHAALGDIRVKGIYSGFSPDMSTGVTFGLKLPTGDYNAPHFDRDTQIGTGSTDLLLGAYHMGNFIGDFNWFANAQADMPVLTIAGYRPGSEIAAATGVYYNGWTIGTVKIAPVAQLVDAYRLQDRGVVTNSQGSGYERLLVAPGVEVDVSGLRVYGDVSIPVYQQVRGNQLVAGALYKLNISHSF